MAQIGRDRRVDVLMPNSWANGLQRIVRGVNPELVITGRENEMGMPWTTEKTIRRPAGRQNTKLPVSKVHLANPRRRRLSSTLKSHPSPTPLSNHPFATLPYSFLLNCARIFSR
jgi:hypothetical protein